MPIGQIAPLSMTPVEALPDAVPSNGRGAPARWPGILAHVVNDFGPGVWVEIRKYTPAGQAQTTRNKLLKRIGEGEFPGVEMAADGSGLILLNGKAAIYTDARNVETETGGVSSVLHMGWQPLPEATVNAAPAEDA